METQPPRASPALGVSASNPLPRKGMETIQWPRAHRQGCSLVELQTHYPARGWKQASVSPSESPKIASYPLPRNVMETITYFSDFLQQGICFKPITPQGDGNSLSACPCPSPITTCFKPITPQGDGNCNITKALLYQLFVCFKPITPQGDGNRFSTIGSHIISS